MPIQQVSCREIQGVRTELVIHNYADRVLVLITQLGKVGCLVRLPYYPLYKILLISFYPQIQASMPPSIPLLPPLSGPDNLPPPPPSIALTPLLGSAPTPYLHILINLYVSQIATLIWTMDPLGDRKPVIVGVALKKSKGAGASNGTSEEQESLSEADVATFKGVMDLFRTSWTS